MFKLNHLLMFKLNHLLLGALAAALVSVSLSASAQAPAAPRGVKNVVLVHGAFADGSSWAKVIPLLQARGYNVIAVQNPLTSLADDVAATQRAIAQLRGPVLLVGHSWAGVVITEAGNDPRVAGLLYVAALAPDDNQSLADVVKGTPPAPGSAEIQADPTNFLTLSAKGVAEYFAQDVTGPENKVIFATQGSWAQKCATDKVTAAAWKGKPVWVLVAEQDRMINPDLQLAAAKRLKATTLTLKSSHVPMVSQPKKVADFIMAAAVKLPAAPVSAR
jgi:pimeloyl-ACP methyl ester carboxylesterase